MKKMYLDCECESPEHLLRFSYFDDDKDRMYVEVHLTTHNFWRRIITGVKYIFGYRSVYGEFGETVLEKDKVQQLRDCCDKFLQVENG